METNEPPRRPEMKKQKALPASPLEAHLGFWMRFVSNHVSARFSRLLEERSVSVTEWVALRVLFGRDGATHAELIEALGMTKGAVSKVVTRLQDKRLAERRPAEGGGRDQQLVLTAAGRRLVPELAALADENDAHFFSSLPPAEREALLAMLQAVVREHGLKELPVA